MEEQIVLLNDLLEPIGVARKLESHHENTPLHLAFSCYIFNDLGQLLVTQRAHTKKVWPGVWTNSVCGHPLPNETFETAIQRRANDELGTSVQNIASVLPDYRYQTPLFNGIRENEFCPVFIAKVADEIIANPAEVAAWQWMSMPDFLSYVERSADRCSYWMKQQVTLLRQAQHPLFKDVA